MLEIPFRPHKFLCSSALVSNLPCQSGEELVLGASAVQAEAVFVQVALELLTSAVVGSGQKCFEVAQCLGILTSLISSLKVVWFILLQLWIYTVERFYRPYSYWSKGPHPADPPKPGQYHGKPREPDCQSPGIGPRKNELVLQNGCPKFLEVLNKKKLYTVKMV